MIRIKSLFYKESINESLLWTILVFLKLKFLVSSTKKEIERREKLSIFEYSELAKPLHYYPYHLLYENDLYGNGKIIFKAIKDQKNIVEMNELIKREKKLLKQLIIKREEQLTGYADYIIRK
jgi:hypothetical protein